MMRYAVITEQAGDKVSAYVPDLPGCVATAAFNAQHGPDRENGTIQGLRAAGVGVPAGRIVNRRKTAKNHLPPPPDAAKPIAEGSRRA